MPASPSKVSNSALQPKSLNSRLLGITIAACFCIGVAWPLVSGFDLAPRPPGLKKRLAKKPSLSNSQHVSKPVPTSTGKDSESKNDEISLSRSAPLLTRHETTRIRRTVVVGCGATDSAFGNQCDQPHLLEQLQEPLRLLAQCQAAEGASGLLSLGLKLDFGRGHVSRVKSGKSTTLPAGRAQALITCAKTSVVGTPLRGIEHDHRYYWIYYLTEFIPPGSPLSVGDAPPAEEVIPASGRATVGWTTAQVRKSPDHLASLTAELEFGTRVQVIGRLGVWYKVKFGSPTQQGWVHEVALGL